MAEVDGSFFKDWSKYIGNRCIVKGAEYPYRVVEVKVLEVSPSKRLVKFKFPSGYGCWEEANRYLLVESLENE